MFDFEDKKGALVKRVGQGWGSDSSPHSGYLLKPEIVFNWSKIIT